MNYHYSKFAAILCGILSFLNFQFVFSQIVPVGSGSYTSVFPGTDSSGRNAFPSGSPLVSGNAVGKPIPTNDWWSLKVKQNHVNNLFNYPLAMKTATDGLVMSYIVPASTPNGSTAPIDPAMPITIGVTGLNATQATVSDFSDWTVSMNWSNAAHSFTATSGIGMPFVYFTKNASDVAQVKITEGTVTVSGEMLLIANSHQGADFAVYAPVGSSWTQNGNVYTSTLNNKNYWSIGFLPPSASDLASVANEYKQYAYVFPVDTQANWTYDSAAAKLTTTFSVETDVKEGSGTNVLLGLLPHQWAHLTSAEPTGYSYTSIRGEIKTIGTNSFTVENTFHGILTTLPYVDNYSPGFDPAKLASKIAQIENDGLAEWTDSYNEGQLMNRLIQTARIADEMGNTASRDLIVATIKQRLEDWLKAESGEVAFLFYYNTTWNALLGYPAGHGQDSNINDHHFHWGYFIHAAAFMEQFEPGWASQWGDMVNVLIRDAASNDRNDPLFPYLRNFSPYAGHSWANGFATFPMGNDQESTSESMQFASSLIHWGTITENNAIRDLGIYIYTTEQTAIDEYWFDQHERTFKPGYGYKLASRIWGNGYDNQTFWTSDIAAAYGIELYPMHGGSFYLGHNQTYLQSLWSEITINTGILSNQANANLWHDVYWQYLALTDAQAAINLYDSYPNRALKFGISDAQTYHWLHSLNALGTVTTAITADYPIAATFNNDGLITYVAHNYSDAPITVTFSDGYELDVPANDMVTSWDIDVSGTLSADFYQAYPGGSVNLTATTSGEGVTKVSFYSDGEFIGEDTSAPYTMPATNLSAGIHSMYARVYAGDLFAVTNVISIQVGEQLPFSGTPAAIPGTVEAGNYDIFEGGIGQHISYFDSSMNNQGGYRPTEYVDASIVAQEGATVGWIDSGEWMEYTVNVQTSGVYDVAVRYASNSGGVGIFRFELDGNSIGSEIQLTNTGGWGNWATQTETGIELTQGTHVLRVSIINGEFNLGRMTFSLTGPLSYTPPIANAGANVSVSLPATTATLDGSQSFGEQGAALQYSWEQIYGPSTIFFNTETSVNPTISNLVAGIYKCRLTVSDGEYSSFDEVLIIVGENGNANPLVAMTSPAEGTGFGQGETITITASASDIDGSISVVRFYDGADLLGEDASAPYSFEWTGAAAGTHSLTAIAIDNAQGQSISSAVNINVLAPVSCTIISNEAQQGSFSTGYELTFTTTGNVVTVTITLLDTDKVGVVAYLWQQSPFAEQAMNNVSGLTFTRTIGSFNIGQTISFGVKFAYAGGMSVTDYYPYEVGDNCNLGVDDLAGADGITLYPNPAKDKVRVRANASEISKVELYSVIGKKIIETTDSEIDVSGLPTGLYLVKIWSETTSVTKKLIKE